MGSSGFNTRANLFEYTDYRAFLRDSYNELKTREGSRFSFRGFSRRAGFASPNFLKLVIDGKRNLSIESAEKFAHAFKLSRDEANFFRSLVAFNQAKTAEERARSAKQLFRYRKFKSAQPLKESQFNYYSRWYLIPIRELVASEHFREDPRWIAGMLCPPISPEEASGALSDLTNLGLLKRGSDGKLVQADSIIDTGDTVASSSIVRFHQEMLKKAAESIDRFPASEREISSATVGISEANAQRIKELILEFRRALLAIASEDQAIERIYEIGPQLFPLTKRPSEGGSQ